MIKKLICLLWGCKTVIEKQVYECRGDLYNTTYERLPFCRRCGNPVRIEDGERECVWSFETDEQADSFMSFVNKLPKERSAIAVISSRQYLRVLLNSQNLMYMAQAFHFGWMNCQDFIKRDKDEALNKRGEK